MFNWILKQILGSKNQRELKRMMPIVRRINELDEEFKKLSDDELRAKTKTWQDRLAPVEDQAARQAILDEILPEAFAVVKNGARRLCGRTLLVCDQELTWNMIHFDVQLIGGMVLHSGRIAEMATGEGKTLVATLPLYLNALTGRGSHLVTVNDYLARRDAEWMGTLYRFLGLTCGCVQHDQPPDVRRAQYACDITYGINSELGFDYLRDNGMATTREQQVQRGYIFAIVDEVDSILIDEARTPLIIAGPATVSTHQYDKFKPGIEQLVRKQGMLCGRLVNEAKAFLDDGKNDEGGTTLYKVKLGQPRNKALLRLLEDPINRKALDKAELSFHGDTRKDELFALKEELFFTIEERSSEADLSEQGRGFLSPDEPDAFVLPDLMTGFADIDVRTDLDDAAKERAKAGLQASMDNRAERIHNISQLLRAYCLYERDVEYVVEENKVVIVDQNTGRKMPGRRWSDGLHQAVEAKEGVQIDKETQTLATITIQNYFRLYQKLAGMTGTAETEANEFHDIYKLDVVVIPTNRGIARQDANDRIYKTRREKYNAVIAEIKERHATGQPVLVGTASVESSELLSRMLKREKIAHSVLNAKYHRQEAEIVARAGQRDAVTISTNMAGRGTDIKLGQDIDKLGGLMVLGTERHSARRIDRQLRGRCARQGDPGASRFYVSFEDDLMRNFGASDRMTSIMEAFGLEDGQELEHPLLNRSVENAQKRVEQRDYMSRKHTLEYDDVMNKQREVVYGYRNEILDTDNPRHLIDEVIAEAIPAKVREYVPEDGGEEPNHNGLLNWANMTFPLGLSAERAAFDKKSAAEIGDFLVARITQAYDHKCSHEDPEAVRALERYIVLGAVDRLWQEHLFAMDGLREGIQLQRIGQKDPLVEYKNEAYSMFVELMANLKLEVLHHLFRSTSNIQAFEQFLASLPQTLLHGALGSPEPGQRPAPENEEGNRPPRSAPSATVPVAEDAPPRLEIPSRREPLKAGRNDPCPCGSGKKFKNCCGHQTT